MHAKFYLTPLSAFLTLSLIGQAQAVQPVDMKNIKFHALLQNFQLSGGKQPSAAVMTNSLELIGQHKDRLRVNHLRLQQKYHGFRVLGGYAIMHSRKSLPRLLISQNIDNSDLKMTGRVYPKLSDELGQPPASFSKESHAALAEFKAKYPGGFISEERVEPVVYIDKNSQSHWAYRVSLLVTPMDAIPLNPVAILEANTHQVLAQWDDIKTSRKAAKGQGFGGNEKVGSLSYGQNFPFLNIMRDDKTKRCYMENTEVRIVDMQHKYTAAKRAMTFDCADTTRPEAGFLTGYQGDGYDKENGAFSPSNDALYAGYVIKHMYHDWYGVEALVKPDGSPMQLIMRVHYGKDYENAYWDGKQMTFGDGGDSMYPLVSLGVGAHEVSHGFTEHHSNLEYHGQSGGMNESFSDMAAQAAEFYSQGKASWTIGAEIMKENSGYEVLRYMDKPSKDGDSIDRADDYYDGLDVHHSSGVFNRLFYLMATQSGWDVRKAFDLVVKANMDYWTPYSTFDEGGCGIIDAAKDLNLKDEEVKSALSEVGINIHSCE